MDNELRIPEYDKRKFVLVLENAQVSYKYGAWRGWFAQLFGAPAKSPDWIEIRGWKVKRWIMGKRARYGLGAPCTDHWANGEFRIWLEPINHRPWVNPTSATNPDFIE